MNVREQRAAHYAPRPREVRLRIGSVEIRSAEDGTIGFSGYASVTEAPYEVTDQWGEYAETIARGAFGKTLRESADVRFLINHDGIPLARTKSGTLTLREITDPLEDPQGRGQTGLWSEAPSLDPASPLVQSLVSAMSRGDMDEMSFAFASTRETWNEDWTQREINELRLYDVSVVTYPANPATSAGLRSSETAPEPELDPRAEIIRAQGAALEIARLRAAGLK